ncbi:hypothetical protein Tco_1057654 [Tanacetum coccineum]|uniref:Uncharacterized protein n=1 Tax=Tanacetum coccineum TaxID=301880 RepID=A0ABQ5H610_9ASTR
MEGDTMAATHGADVKDMGIAGGDQRYGHALFRNGTSAEDIPLDDTWQVHMDFMSLNKVCPKDMYPFPEVEEKLGSIIGYRYKCFLGPPQEGSQVRMSKEDEEKMAFHIEGGILCYTNMPKGLKNSEATYQRMTDKVLIE